MFVPFNKNVSPEYFFGCFYDGKNVCHFCVYHTIYYLIAFCLINVGSLLEFCWLFTIIFILTTLKNEMLVFRLEQKDIW